MRRLCIYVTYDPENMIDDYIGYTLQEMRKTVDSLIVVCNYKCIVSGRENIQPYANKIFCRENAGFDAGAYQDVFFRYLGWDGVCGYDEILLVNDSFYGPLYSFEKLFRRMEEVNADYWGMTRCPEGELADGSTYKPHIQSYFLALRKNVLINKEFQEYWENMEYPISFMQTVITFEIGVNKLLQQLGFVGSAVMDLCPVQWNLKKNENPYLLYPLELIRDADIPVLKRKSLSMSNKGFESAIKALRFIKDECSYDVSLIENHLRRIGEGKNVMGIEAFYASHSRIFIYGAGFYGKNVAEYFAYKGWTFEKFLVTDMAGQPENDISDCIAFDGADIAEDDGIIIAVGNKKGFREIVRLVKKRCRKEQIFNPEDIIW
ncbi:MAG: rhamnan synthesis F family protein [Lachnospiraceae bacterium]|nr:rhamnan synthesis F family protein [Lachnospiraceae bacterium]